MTYFDIDDILSDTRPVQSRFLVGCNYLGRLDPSLDNVRDLPAQSKIIIPLWLALHLSQRVPVQLEIPQIYGKLSQNDLLAGSLHQDLASKSLYFYEMGCKIALLFYVQAPQITTEIAHLLEIVLRERVSLSLAVHGSSSNGKDINMLNFMHSLTELEKKIFLFKEGSKKDIINMYRGLTGMIKTSYLILSARNSKSRTALNFTKT